MIDRRPISSISVAHPDDQQDPLIWFAEVVAEELHLMRLMQQGGRWSAAASEAARRRIDIAYELACLDISCNTGGNPGRRPARLAEMVARMLPPPDAVAIECRKLAEVIHSRVMESAIRIVWTPEEIANPPQIEKITGPIVRGDLTPFNRGQDGRPD